MAHSIRFRLAAVFVALLTVWTVLGGLAYRAATFHGNIYALDQLVLGVCSVPIGLWVVWRRTDHLLGYLLIASGAGFLLTFDGSSILDWMISRNHVHMTTGRVILATSVGTWIVGRFVLIALVPAVYPFGRRRGPVWSVLWWVAVGGIAVTWFAHTRVHTFEYFDGESTTGFRRFLERTVAPWSARVVLACAVVMIVGMVVRVARLERADRRAHLAFAVVTAALSFPVVNSFIGEAIHHEFVISEEVLVGAAIAMPFVLSYGILRHGLLDIEVVVRRTVVYAAVVVAAGAVYVVVVLVLQPFLSHSARTSPLLATGVVAVSALPLHTWVQRTADRRLFGNRSRPYDVLAALGNELELAAPADEALQRVVDTVARELALPFVAIDLDVRGEPFRAAIQGRAVESTEQFPLTRGGEHIGVLMVARRTPNEPFGAGERRLLEDLARQAGVVAENVLLTQDLLASRRVLLQAREEERRRIRRDLHDGLGPTLASVSLGLGAAAERLGDDRELGSLLRDLEGELADAIADVRRLVYDLRPPVLDDIGLVRALEEHAANLQRRAAGSHGAPAIDIDAVRDLDVPAAVEVAVYRVALEAMTNVTRHAQAARCWVSIAVDEPAGELYLRIDDDGSGIEPAVRAGVGLRSMRDRVAELGGSLAIGACAPRGTSIVARFPLVGGLT